MLTDRLRVVVNYVDGEAVLVVVGEVDAATAPTLRAAVAAIGAFDVRVVFDLAEVTFMDSSGLSVIAETLLRLRHSSGSSLGVRNPSAFVRQLLVIAGIDPFVNIEVDSDGPAVDLTASVETEVADDDELAGHLMTDRLKCVRSGPCAEPTALAVKPAR